VSRYTVEATLGRGGMATVELARDAQLGRKVAIKRLFASLVDDETFQARFLREARLAAGLSHPNLVAVYDAGEEAGVPYIVMEYVEGETLAQLMRRTGPLPPDRAVEILLQVCAGLGHAHAAGLIHRDIKPQNLLVRHDGVVKIADFGIARTLQATQLTQAGTVLGTAAYLAPEQAAGQPVTAAADIYSLGAVSYELLAGRTPYEFDSLADLTFAQRQPPRPIDGVPPQLERAVVGALAFRPEDRPESAAAFARELGQDESTSATEVMPRTPTTHVPRRALLAGTAGLAVLLAALGLGYAYLGDGDSPRRPASPPERADVLPRGDTPSESARLLAEWLRERSG
jgi:eukaryotic-like serine/threonine-protein kinase